MKKGLCSGLLLVISLGLHAQFDFEHMIENIIIKSVEMIALSPKNKTNPKKTVAPKPLIIGRKYPVKDVSLVWKKKANEYKAKLQGQSDIRNQGITCAYAKMYMQNPDTFKWAGLAALMSGKIGNYNKLAGDLTVTIEKIKEKWNGLSNDFKKQDTWKELDKLFKDFFNNNGEFEEIQKKWDDFFNDFKNQNIWEEFDKLFDSISDIIVELKKVCNNQFFDFTKQNVWQAITEWRYYLGDCFDSKNYDEAKKLNADIMLGNKAVFEDIFWQHLAFNQKGIAEIERLFFEKRIGKSAYEAWELIANGKVWEGNLLLLKYEQEHVLQSIIYDTHMVIWHCLNLATTKYFGILISPVPDHYNEFPGDNIAYFEERWKWIVEDIMPAWESFETDANNRERLLEALREVCKDCCD